jgi:hypothetical protein
MYVLARKALAAAHAAGLERWAVAIWCGGLVAIGSQVYNNLVKSQILTHFPRVDLFPLIAAE